MMQELYNKLPERVEYTPPKRTKKGASHSSNQRKRGGRSRFRGKPRKPSKINKTQKT